MSHLLIQDEPLLVSKKLATHIGLNEAIFLQQLHYWVLKSTFTAENQNWVYNTYEEWQKQFPFWSISTIRRIISSLKDRGLIQLANFNKKKSDQTKWYAIHYEELQALEEGTTLPTGVQSDDLIDSNRTDENVNMNNEIAQSEQYNDSTWTDESLNLDKPLPKITSEITSKISSKNNNVNDNRVHNAMPTPFSFFEENGFGTIGSYISEKITAWCNDLSDELVIMAMEFAVEQGHKSWKYIEAILRNWVDKGYQSRQDVNAAENNFRENKKKPHTSYQDEIVKQLQNGNDNWSNQPTTNDIDYEQVKKELEIELQKYNKKDSKL